MEHLSPFNPNLIQSFRPHQGLLFKMKHCLLFHSIMWSFWLNKAARGMESVLLQKLLVNFLLVIKPRLCLLQLLKLL
jgi:hypothetical protein